MYGYVTIVASVLLMTPIQKLSPTLNLPPPAPARRASVIPLTLSNTPYVMAGLTVKTKPGFKPVQSPVNPDSATISRPTSRSDLDDLEDEICCRRAMTDTGIVKIWAKAPANAPSSSS